MTRQDFEALLNIKEDLIPTGRQNRPGTPNSRNFITIHNTDNANAGADALAHAKFVKNVGHYNLPNGKKNWVSWHFTIDDQRIVQHLPTREKAIHAGSANSQSIAIEICMNKGIDQDKAFLNAARLSAALLFDLPSLKRDVGKVVPHKFWTGKDCPRLLLDNQNTVGNKWNKFLKLIGEELNSINTLETTPALEAELQLEPEIDETLKEIYEVNPSLDFHHFEVSDPDPEQMNSVSIEKQLFNELQTYAQNQGVSVETLANIWLYKKLRD